MYTHRDHFMVRISISLRCNCDWSNNINRIITWDLKPFVSLYFIRSYCVPFAVPLPSTFLPSVALFRLLILLYGNQGVRPAGHRSHRICCDRKNQRWQRRVMRISVTTSYGFCIRCKIRMSLQIKTNNCHVLHCILQSIAICEKYFLSPETHNRIVLDSAIQIWLSIHNFPHSLRWWWIFDFI